jgi:hypothetical protein
MDKSQIISLVLGSAAVGALVSSLMTLTGQYFERKSRKREIILGKAIEMAHQRFENTITALRDSGQQGKIVPEIYMALQYHKSLTALFETGDLDEEMKATLKSQGMKLT